MLLKCSNSGVSVGNYSKYVTGWTSRLWLSVDANDFCFHHHVQTGSGAELVSCWKVSGVIFPKYSGRDEKLNIGLQLVHWLRMHEVIPLCQYVFIGWCLLKNIWAYNFLFALPELMPASHRYMPKRIKVILLSCGSVHNLSMQNASVLENVKQASNIEQDILTYEVPAVFRHAFNGFWNSISLYPVAVMLLCKTKKQGFPLRSTLLMTLFWESAWSSGNVLQRFSRTYYLRLQGDWIGVWVDDLASTQTH